MLSSGDAAGPPAARSPVPGPAYVTIIDDPLPAGTTFKSMTAPAGWSCNLPAVGAAGTVSCLANALSPGTATFTLVVHVLPAGSAPTSLHNAASVRAYTGDPTSGNNAASAVLPCRGRRRSN